MKTTRKYMILAVASLAVAALAGAAFAQQNAAQQNNAQVRIEPVRGHIYLLAGAGGNIIASIGPDGILLVDSGLTQNADKVLAALDQLNREIANRGGLPVTSTVPPKPIRYIINTHLHADHTGGNEKISKAGKTITGGNVTGEFGMRPRAPPSSHSSACSTAWGTLSRRCRSQPCLRIPITTTRS